MREDDLPESSNIEDRRGSPGLGGGIRTGGLGIGAIVALSLIGWALGINPLVLINGAEQVTGGSPAVTQNAPAPPGQTGVPTDEVGRFVARVLTRPRRSGRRSCRARPTASTSARCWCCSPA